YHSGDRERGVEACASCHGEKGEGVGRGNPALAGQPAPYVARQLRAWRAGERYGDPLGVMREPAKRLADEEIMLLADHISRIGDGFHLRESLEECLSPRRPDSRSGA